MVGEAWGRHDKNEKVKRDRLALLEYDVLTDTEKWTVAGPTLGLQSRALTVAVDDQKRYHVAGYHCLDDCEPEGDLWGFLPGGTALHPHAARPARFGRCRSARHRVEPRRLPGRRLGRDAGPVVRVQGPGVRA
jgi:hypothetical protein